MSPNRPVLCSALLKVHAVWAGVNITEEDEEEEEEWQQIFGRAYAKQKNIDLKR